MVGDVDVVVADSSEVMFVEMSDDHSSSPHIQQASHQQPSTLTLHHQDNTPCTMHTYYIAVYTMNMKVRKQNQKGEENDI